MSTTTRNPTRSTEPAVYVKLVLDNLLAAAAGFAFGTLVAWWLA